MTDEYTKRLGQGLPEYALILALISVVVIAVLALLGSGTRDAMCSALIGINIEMAADCIAEPEAPDPDEEGGIEIYALAAQRSSTGELIVLAKVPDGSGVTLSLMGYGPMQWVEEKNVFIFRAPIADNPSAVTIVASDGSTLTITVHTR